ncbi:MAG: hypothetical protein M3P50_12995, partial [Actinomycetota bacterium]|nr:hypothetical protein [Actinomycetota bacterium]
MLDALARFLHRRARRVLVVALLFVGVAGALGGPVAGILTDDDDFADAASEAVLAQQRLTAATGASASPDIVALVRLGAPADTRAAHAKLGRVVA